MFRSLAGESGLERKLRRIVGSVLLISLLGSTSWLASQHESLIHESTRKTAAGSVNAALLKHHMVKFESSTAFAQLAQETSESLDKGVYSYRFFHDGKTGGNKPEDEFEWHVLQQFSASPSTPASSMIRPVEFLDRLIPKSGTYRYYEPVRAKKSCIACHVAPVQVGGSPISELKEGDLMAVVRIDVPDDTQRQVNYFRATAISTAIVATFLAMCVSFALIRVVLRPPKQAISEGL